MHLYYCKSLDEGIDGFLGDLLALVEDNIDALEQRCKVFLFNLSRQWFLK